MLGLVVGKERFSCVLSPNMRIDLPTYAELHAIEHRLQKLKISKNTILATKWNGPSHTTIESFIHLYFQKLLPDEYLKIIITQIREHTQNKLPVQGERSSKLPRLGNTTLGLGSMIALRMVTEEGKDVSNLLENLVT